MDKPKIYFVPTNIAALKYYERLIPHLKDSYDVGFLLMRHEGVLLEQVIEYCREKGHSFYVINMGVKKGGMRVPFFSPIMKILAHENACRDFLKKVRPTKLIFEKTKNPMSMMAHVANYLGVETIVLQWCFISFFQGTFFPEEPPRSLLSRAYNSTFFFLYECIRFLFGPKEVMNRSITVTPKKLGIFESHLVSRFNPAPEIVREVGNLDIQMTHELKQHVVSDVFFERSLQEKYKTDRQKINILIFSSGVVSGSSTREEYSAYYKNICADIRTLFPRDKARILLKMHPKYKEARATAQLSEEYGVLIYGGEADSSELACISNLCISDPMSTVNYHILGSDIPAIFVNFSQSRKIEAGKDELGIKEVIHDREYFRAMLEDFKAGKLEKQYDNANLELHAREKILELINIKVSS